MEAPYPEDCNSDADQGRGHKMVPLALDLPPPPAQDGGGIHSAPRKPQTRFRGLTTVRAQTEDVLPPSALHVAALEGRADALEELLAKEDNFKDINAKATRRMWTPLHFAANAANILAFEVLMNYNADCSMKGAEGESPLHLLARRGSRSGEELLWKRVVERMCELGVAMDACNNKNETPMDIAVKHDMKWPIRVLGALNVPGMEQPPETDDFDNSMKWRGQSHELEEGHDQDEEHDEEQEEEKHQDHDSPRLQPVSRAASSTTVEMNSVSGARTADVIVAKAILDQPRSKRETPLLRSDTSEPKLRRYSQGKDRSYIKNTAAWRLKRRRKRAASSLMSFKWKALTHAASAHEQDVNKILDSLRSSMHVMEEALLSDILGALFSKDTEDVEKYRTAVFICQRFFVTTQRFLQLLVQMFHLQESYDASGLLKQRKDILELMILYVTEWSPDLQMFDEATDVLIIFLAKVKSSPSQEDIPTQELGRLKSAVTQRLQSPTVHTPLVTMRRKRSSLRDLHFSTIGENSVGRKPSTGSDVTFSIKDEPAPYKAGFRLQTIGQGAIIREDICAFDQVDPEKFALLLSIADAMSFCSMHPWELAIWHQLKTASNVTENQSFLSQLNHTTNHPFLRTPQMVASGGSSVEMLRPKFLRYLKLHHDEPCANVISLLKRTEKLRKFAASQILLQPILEKRIATIERLILVARKCRAMNNFVSSWSIIQALLHSSIGRLNKTWSSLSSKAQSHMRELLSQMGTQNSLTGYLQLQEDNIAVLPDIDVLVNDVKVLSCEGNTVHFGALAEAMLGICHMQSLVSCSLPQWREQLGGSVKCLELAENLHPRLHPSLWECFSCSLEGLSQARILSDGSSLSPPRVTTSPVSTASSRDPVSTPIDSSTTKSYSESEADITSATVISTTGTATVGPSPAAATNGVLSATEAMEDDSAGSPSLSSSTFTITALQQHRGAKGNGIQELIEVPLPEQVPGVDMCVCGGRIVVKAATVAGIFDLILSPKLFGIALNIIDVLCLTQPLYIKSSALLARLLQKYMPPQPKELLEAEREFFALKQQRLRKRILFFLECWIDRQQQVLSQDREVRDMLQGVIDADLHSRKFARRGSLAGGGGLRMTAEDEADLSRLLARLNAPAMERVKSAEAVKVPDDTFFSKSFPRDASRQLCLIDHEQFCKVSSVDLLQREDDEDDRLTRWSQRFNNISAWASTMVVRQTDTYRRADAIKQLIKLSWNCKDLHNYHASYAIVAGLNNAAIQRLKEAWERVGEKTSARFRTLEVLYDYRSNYVNIREVMKGAVRPVVPFLGLFTKDIFTINANNDDFVAGSEECVESNVDGIRRLAPRIPSVGRSWNFYKLNLLAKVIAQVQHLQTGKYTFEQDDDLRAYLKNLKGLDEDDLYNMSETAIGRDSHSIKREERKTDYGADMTVVMNPLYRPEACTTPQAKRRSLLGRSRSNSAFGLRRKASVQRRDLSKSADAIAALRKEEMEDLDFAEDKDVIVKGKIRSRKSKERRSRSRNRGKEEMGKGEDSSTEKVTLRKRKKDDEEQKRKKITRRLSFRRRSSSNAKLGEEDFVQLFSTSSSSSPASPRKRRSKTKESKKKDGTSLAAVATSTTGPSSSISTTAMEDNSGIDARLSPRSRREKKKRKG